MKEGKQKGNGSREPGGGERTSKRVGVVGLRVVTGTCWAPPPGSADFEISIIIMTFFKYDYGVLPPQ